MQYLSLSNRVLLWSALSLFCSFAAAKEDLNVQRINAACVFELGRLPTAEEIGANSGSGAVTIEAAMKAFAKSADKQVAQRAYRDAFGAEASASPATGGSYLTLMQEHLADLRSDGDAYREVLSRAYQFVIHRDPYDEEFAYWDERGTLPYVLLVGCVEDWARRNQPGLMVTAGEATVSVNCEFLATARLSPKVADEAKAIVGIGDASRVIAAGGEVPASSGGVYFVACGR